MPDQPTGHECEEAGSTGERATRSLAARAPRIASARNDLLIDEAGREYVDLFSGHGTTWLGHANPRLAERLREQLNRVWITGGLPTGVAAQARERIEALFPASHALAGLYSTGMEAAEFAIRLARCVTGRVGVIGFEGSMHGKSLATAYLGWDNHDGVSLPGFQRLPFVSTCGDEEVLRLLEGALAGADVGAVFVEPLQACGGGHRASVAFCERVVALCEQYGALSVYDEILTGFHRTGPSFCLAELRQPPDVVLIGKAMGGGFPVSGVMASRQHPVRSTMLPGSTYAGNPLAAAAVSATLAQMQAMDLPATVARIEAIVTETVASVAESGVALRGRGALWVLELPGPAEAEAVVMGLWHRGVFASFAGRHVRIMPAATIEPGHLRAACMALREVVEDCCHG